MFALSLAMQYHSDELSWEMCEHSTLYYYNLYKEGLRYGVNASNIPMEMYLHVGILPPDDV
jgi:hypothetical protein